MNMANAYPSHIERSGDVRGPCISIYFPAHSGDNGSGSACKRLEGLIGQAEQKLEARGCGPEARRDLLAPLHDLDSPVKSSNQPGFAVFRASGFLGYHAVPFDTPELVCVADHFQLGPLLQLSEPASFYLLCLSQCGATLFEAVSSEVTEVKVSFPDSPLAICRQYDADASEPHKSSCKGRLGFAADRYASKYGKQALIGWFQKVDEVLRSKLGRSSPPLILVGVRWLCSMYRHVSRYPGLLDKEIHGSSNLISPDELWSKGSLVAWDHFQERQRRVADEYLRLWHTSRASNDLRDIEVAARQGRVHALFLGVTGAGTASGKAATPVGGSPAKVQRLLELAALGAFITGGSLYPVPPDQVPGGSLAAAVFRF
jgi:hypothetical protein